MDRCKQQFKKNPRYSAPDGSTVDSRGLFQALLANVVSDAFVVDPKQCGTDEVLKTGTKTNVLCEHVGHGVKLRSVVKPILQLVAKDELEEALAKAANFAGDFQAAEVDWKDFEATQAIAKVHAAMSVSLREFAILRSSIFRALFCLATKMHASQEATIQYRSLWPLASESVSHVAVTSSDRCSQTLRYHRGKGSSQLGWAQGSCYLHCFAKFSAK